MYRRCKHPSVLTQCCDDPVRSVVGYLVEKMPMCPVFTDIILEQ